jgi:hypothetical protein
MGTATQTRVTIYLSVFIIMLAAVHPARAIPAFARKYNLPCSACHEAWPKLNNFGQVFRDNGYQLEIGRDAPIYQQLSYWPITFRVTPEWHRESNNGTPVDVVPGNSNSGTRDATVTTSGFAFPAVDIFTAGTLYKNISFAVQAYLDNQGQSRIQSLFIRFDNLLGSHWLNFKFGEFELDTLLSAERILTLNNTGGFYTNYQFLPPGDSSFFQGLAERQPGIELMGHSTNSYTRYSVALVSSNGGQAASNKSYDLYADFTQGFEVPGLGLQRVGVYGYLGQSPTFFQTDAGVPIPGTGTGNRSFYRTGAYGLWYVKKFDLSTFYEHGVDNAFLGNAIPANQPLSLPPGAVGPSWNGGYLEAHYTYNPRLILVGRYELVRVSRQANPGIRSDLGDLDTWTVGYRLYPFMSSRAGLAWVQEYSRQRSVGTAPLTGRDVTSSSLLMGFDFDF